MKDPNFKEIFINFTYNNDYSEKSTNIGIGSSSTSSGSSNTISTYSKKRTDETKAETHRSSSSTIINSLYRVNNESKVSLGNFGQYGLKPQVNNRSDERPHRLINLQSSSIENKWKDLKKYSYNSNSNVFKNLKYNSMSINSTGTSVVSSSKQSKNSLIFK